MLKRSIPVILFILAVIFLFGVGIDRIPLWSSDEGRFGEKAREMWELKDFIVPHFNYMVSIEKPVLAYGLTALSYGIFGVSNWSTRLVPVVSAMLGIGICFGFTRRLFDRKTAAYASVILLTSIGYVLVGRFAVIDMLMTLFLSGALFSMLTACLQKKGRYYLLAYLLMGLAFLTKGLIGILLPFLVFFAFLIWSGKLGEIKRMKLGWGILIMAAVILPWCVAISKKQPDFFNVFIVQNHFTRFSTGSFGRKRPFWFFIPILIATMFPWSFFLPAAVARALKREATERVKLQFLICWIAVMFVFFSIPKSKLPYYLLPLSMPMAVLIADLFAGVSGAAIKSWEERLSRMAWQSLPVVAALIFVGVNLYLFLPFPKIPPVSALWTVLQIGGLVIFLGVSLAFSYYRKARPGRAFFTLSTTVYLGLLLTVAGMFQISPFQSTAAFADVLKPRLQANDVVGMLSSPDHFSDFPFHLQRRVMIVGTDWGEFRRYEKDPRYSGEMQQWFLASRPFVGLFTDKSRRVYCLVEEKKLRQLKADGLAEYYVIKQGYGCMLISNVPD